MGSAHVGHWHAKKAKSGWPVNYGIAVAPRSTCKEGENGLPLMGIPYVIVNGTIVLKDSKVLKGVYPGHPIRNAVLD